MFIAFLALMLCSSCNFWRSENKQNNAEIPDAEIQTNIPFSNKEPENFQAEIVVSNFANDKKSVQKYFIAKNDKSSIQKFDFGTENERSILRTGDNKIFLINKKSKNYRELSADNSEVFSDDSLIKNLTSKWLNEKSSASFEKLGTENALTKYRVTLEDGKSSEIFIFVDEKLKIPIKQEFYSVNGEEKKLQYSVEIQKIKINIDSKLFELPKGYKIIDQQPTINQ